LFFTAAAVHGQQAISADVVNASRNSCVRIMSRQAQLSGTGFFISGDVIATCFNVISNISRDSAGQIGFTIFPDLIAVTAAGDTVSLNCISVPTSQSPEPLYRDFALLRTSRTIARKSVLSFGSTARQGVLEPILFTGFALGTPAMVTHTGTISGFTKDSSVFTVQAPVNRGQSGGALLDRSGKVIGLISLREGGVSVALQEYLKQVTESPGKIAAPGTDLRPVRDMLFLMDDFITSGIGFAINIKYLNAYIRKNNITL
jgi:S1-C subfamily serine protease